MHETFLDLEFSLAAKSLCRLVIMHDIFFDLRKEGIILQMIFYKVGLAGLAA